MQCQACGTANEPGRKFCGECGTPLAVSCPTCGAANAPGVKFCGECGTDLRLGAAQAVATDRQTNVASKPPVPGDHPDGAIEYAPPALHRRHPVTSPRTGAGRQKI